MRLTAVLLGCAFASTAVRADPAEDVAVKELEKAGARIDEKRTFVNLAHRRVTGAVLKQLAALRNLTTLILWDTWATDADVKELAALKSLTTLDLRQTKVTDAGLKELTGLERLTHLKVSFAYGVTDAGVRTSRPSRRSPISTSHSTRT